VLADKRINAKQNNLQTDKTIDHVTLIIIANSFVRVKQFPSIYILAFIYSGVLKTPGEPLLPAPQPPPPLLIAPLTEDTCQPRRPFYRPVGVQRVIPHFHIRDINVRPIGFGVRSNFDRVEHPRFPGHVQERQVHVKSVGRACANVGQYIDDFVHVGRGR